MTNEPADSEDAIFTERPACPRCRRLALENDDVDDVRVEMRATMPLLVVVRTCPACGQNWQEAREPESDDVEA